MSPAISNCPWVDNADFFVFDNTSLMPSNWAAAADVSFLVVAAFSPAVAVSIALTSAAVFGITSMFRFLKSVKLSAATPNARSRD